MCAHALADVRRRRCHAPARLLDRGATPTWPLATRTRTSAQRAQDLVDLYTPIAKAWVTDTGVEVASLGIQVHGGMGYMEDTACPTAMARRPHRPDLRGHQRHPGHRPGDPKDHPARRRTGLRPVRPDGRDRRAVVESGPLQRFLADAVESLRTATHWLIAAVGDAPRTRWPGRPSISPPWATSSRDGCWPDGRSITRGRSGRRRRGDGGGHVLGHRAPGHHSGPRHHRHIRCAPPLSLVPVGQMFVSSAGTCGRAGEPPCCSPVSAIEQPRV